MSSYSRESRSAYIGEPSCAQAVACCRNAFSRSTVPLLAHPTLSPADPSLPREWIKAWVAQPWRESLAKWLRASSAWLGLHSTSYGGGGARLVDVKSLLPPVNE